MNRGFAIIFWTFVLAVNAVGVVAFVMVIHDGVGAVILEPGSFRVSDYRRNIPDWVKVVAAVKRVLDHEGGLFFDVVKFARSLEYDHRPPLSARSYNEEIGDFIPAQNDPEYIVATPKAEHRTKTFGNRTTTAGSDIHANAQARRLADKQAVHAAKMASKAGDYKTAAALLGSVKRKSRLKPKPKIPSRGFSKRHQPMRKTS